MTQLFDLYCSNVGDARLSYSGFTIFIDGVSTSLHDFISILIDHGVSLGDIPAGLRNYYTN